MDLAAYRYGARFDSWDDQFRPDIWQKVYREIPQAMRHLWLEQKQAGFALPWHDLIDGVKIELLHKDYQRYDSINKDNMNPPHKQALRKSGLSPGALTTSAYPCREVLRQMPF